ncbi:MAG: hypothetical protein V8T90_15440 [Victivallales bacterium]
MTPIGKSIATATAIAATAAGVAVYEYAGSGEPATETAKTAETTEYVDNVQPVKVYIPKVNVVKVRTPKLNKPEIRIPEVNTFEYVSPVIAKMINLPEVETHAGLPKSAVLSVVSAAAATVTTPEVTDYRTVRVSTTNMPEVIRAAVRIPEVEVRIAADNTIRIPSPSGVVVVVPSAGGDVIAVPSPQGYRITLPEVRDPAARMPQLIALQKIQRTLFRDQRNLIYDSSIGIDSAVWAKWIRIYQADEPYDMPHVELTDGLRMIAEVTVPEDRAERETLNTNLERYVALGYNAALLTFDTTEPLDSLVELAELIRSKGLAVWIAYSGPENLRHSIFADPDRLANCVRTLAELADGLVIGWRRTALHLFVQDRPFYNVILRAARAGNPKLQILGESYIGETAETPEYTRIAMFNNPANCSGTVVSGIGFYGVNVAGALTGVFKPVAHMNRVALIVGSKPYHQTLHRTGLSRERQEAVKQRLERRFRAAGCRGTITLHGDGGAVTVDGKKKITDSLCR